MSIRTAAALAGISEARWRQLERGSREIRGVPVTEEAPDPTLARMALAVRLTYDDLLKLRPAAAHIFAELAAERAADGERDADDAARMVDALNGRSLTARQREALESQIASALRTLREE